MPGTYSIISRSSGTLLTAAVYMQDHQTHLTYATPGGVDDYSTNLAQMQSTVDPGESGSESLPTDLAGELQRIRNVLAEITGKTYWYQTPPRALVDGLTTVASASSPDIWTPRNLAIDYTGTATCTGFTAAPQAGARRILICAGAAVFTAGANMLIDGVSSGQSFTAAAGDRVYVLALTTTQFRLQPVTVALSQFVYSTVSGNPGRLQFPAMWIRGLTYANNAGDPTNDLDITAGQCRDATDAHNLLLSALTKQSDVAWAVGTNAGMLDTGSIGNNDYFLWAILRSDTGICDVLCSLSSTAPTMPTNYDFKRLVGWFKRVGGTIVAFHTYERESGGLEYLWDTPTTDINLINTLTTARRTDAVKVPLTFSVLVHLLALTNDASTAFYAIIYCPDHTDLVPSIGQSNSSMPSTLNAGVGVDLWIRTSSTGTVAARATLATVDSYIVTTLGFHWARCT